jgi:hypothetical protein
MQDETLGNGVTELMTPHPNHCCEGILLEKFLIAIPQTKNTPA